MAYLSQFYEVVLFTSQPLYVSASGTESGIEETSLTRLDSIRKQTALPVADKLDPFQAYLPYKLFRESTRYIKGKVVKVSRSWTGCCVA